MHRYLWLFIALFALGILIRSFTSLGWAFIGVGGVLSIVVVVYSVTTRKAVVVAVGLCALTLGFARMEVAIPTITTDDRIGEEVQFEGIIVREPDVRENYTNLTVQSDDFEQLLLVRADPYADYAYYDAVDVTGRLDVPENFEGDTGRIFNYRGYLAKDGVYYIVSFPEVSVSEQTPTLIGRLYAVKHAYLDAIKHALPEPASALAGGITVGEKRSLGDELTDDFRVTGLIHIVVLSGYNVAIVVIFINFLLGFLPPKPRQVAAIGGIALFTVLVGASATTVRAALMGGIASFGIIAGRTNDALHALFLAGLAMMLWNPYVVAFDPSFQLSFVATFGLLIGVPLLTPYLMRVPNMLRELIAATVATQIAVLPLLAYMMGSVSVVALAVNVLVLSVIPIAMLAVFLTGVAGMLYGTLAIPFAFGANVLLQYVFIVVDLFANIPFAALEIPEFSFGYVVVLYVMLAIFVATVSAKMPASLREEGRTLS